MQDNNHFIIQQVINDLLDTQTSIESALLKLNYFSRLVKNEKLLRYTELEINGYKAATPPKYRQAIAKLTVIMENGYQKQQIEIPISALEPPFNTELQYIKMLEGVRIIEAMAAKNIVEADQAIGTPLPVQMLRMIKKITDKVARGGFTPTSAMVSGNPTLSIQIVSTIRYNLLAFATEIAEKFGYNIAISDFKAHQQTNNQIINNFVQNQIINRGNHNVNNTGDSAKLKLKQKSKDTTSHNTP